MGEDAQFNFEHVFKAYNVGIRFWRYGVEAGIWWSPAAHRDYSES